MLLEFRVANQFKDRLCCAYIFLFFCALDSRIEKLLSLKIERESPHSEISDLLDGEKPINVSKLTPIHVEFTF